MKDQVQSTTRIAVEAGKADQRHLGQKVQKSSRTLLDISIMECPACGDHSWLSTVQAPHYFLKGFTL